MQSPIQIEQIEPSYNGYVVPESIELATALDQYWLERRTLCEQTIERYNVAAGDSAAERDWQSFCSRGTTFLNKYLSKAADSIDAPLREFWRCSFSMAREAKKVFQRSVTAEIWIPFSQYPVKFVRVSADNGSYDIRDTSRTDQHQAFSLGKPYIAICWEENCLFLIVPSRAYVTMSTFTFSKDGQTWSTEEVLPSVFADSLVEFQDQLHTVERRFAPLRALWNAREQVSRATAQLHTISCSADTWQRVQLPDAQKLDILRRMELFENSDPAAPRGLLLHGPTGTGKSLIARTLAETLSCDFQSLSLADIKEEHLGASGKRVREIWDHARAHQPSIIFIDECDGVFGRRGAAETDVIAADVVGSFLPEWDGIDETSGIMVIGATNKRSVLDDAIISRFGWEMEVPLPSAPERRRILEQELRANRIDMELPEDTTSLTQGMSGRDIRNLAAATKSLSYPNAPSSVHLQEAAGTARKRGNAQIGWAATWDSLALEPGALERLRLISALLSDAEKWRAQGVGVPNSLLLTGSDGGIKRQLAQTLSNESGLTFLAPTLSDFKANYSGQSGNRVKLFFERARASSPAIVFLDRLDMIAPNRNVANATDVLSNEIIGQLAQECERAQFNDGHVFLLGATSNPERVDPEVLDCFQERMAVTLPNRDARIKLFTRLLTNKKIDFSLDDGAILLAELTEGKSFDSRDIENSVQAAQQKALLRAVRNGGPEHYSIALDDFEPLQTA
jgi:SpoVK/Ycf46/Vps4 family AAA+-type ATPase